LNSPATRIIHAHVNARTFADLPLQDPSASQATPGNGREFTLDGIWQQQTRRSTNQGRFTTLRAGVCRRSRFLTLRHQYILRWPVAWSTLLTRYGSEQHCLRVYMTPTIYCRLRASDSKNDRRGVNGGFRQRRKARCIDRLCSPMQVAAVGLLDAAIVSSPRHC
jgi:hypothetical protein